jgi:hypothetical protein
MGLAKQLRSMTKEYLKDPRGQYFHNLNKVLNLSKRSNVKKEEVVKFVNVWAKQ